MQLSKMVHEGLFGQLAMSNKFLPLSVVFVSRLCPNSHRFYCFSISRAMIHIFSSQFSRFFL